MKLLLNFFKKNYIVAILFFVLLFSIYFLNKRFNIIEGLKKSTAKKAVVSAAASVFGGTLGYSIQDDINNNKNTINKITKKMNQDGPSYGDKIKSIKRMLNKRRINDNTVKQIIDDGTKSINTSIYTYVNSPNANIEKSLVEKINGILSEPGKSYSDKLNSIKTDTSLYNENIEKIVFDGEKDIIFSLNTYIKLLEQQITQV